MVVLALGVVIAGTTNYQVTGGRDAVQGGNDLLMLIKIPHGSPAIGLYAAEAAGILAIVAGVMLAYLSRKRCERLVA